MGRRRSRRIQRRLDQLDHARERLAQRRFRRRHTRVQVRRPLTGRERAVVLKMLDVETPGSEQFRSQVDCITVVYACDCGACGTISFEVDETRGERAPLPRWDEYAMVSESSGSAWLMLFQRDGWLSELEHVPGYGPSPEQLDPDGLEVEPDADSDAGD